MIEPRPEVLGVPAAAHGGPSGPADERRPVRLDFSTSVSAYGPAPAVVDAARRAPLDAYPDPESLGVRRLAAERWGRPVEEIVFGAGAAELIHLAAFAYLRPGDDVLVAGPTFGEYERSALLCGARVREFRAEPPAYAINPAALAAAVRAARARLAFLCAPNNPTGQLFAAAELREVADACEAAGTLLVLDQSYNGFAGRPLGTPALPGHGAVLHLRSITKDHALAGVRAGFAVAPPAVAAALAGARVPWAASAVAQAAAAASLGAEAQAHALDAAARLRAGRGRLQEALTALGVPHVATGTHYLLADVGDAALVRERLLVRHAIKVRDCTSFGLPRHVRVAARTPAENDVLAAALRSVL